MERAEQDADGRFNGGIFSGQEGQAGKPAYRNDAAGRDSLYGRQEGYGTSPADGMAREQAVRPPFRDGRPAAPAFSNRQRDYFRNACGRMSCSCECQRCPRRRPSNQMMLLIVAVSGMGMLFCAFLSAMFLLFCLGLRQSGEDVGNGNPMYKDGWEAVMPFLPDEETGRMPDSSHAGREPEAEYGNHGEYYGEIRDAVRTDLSYSIEWVNYEYEGNSDTVSIAIDYPVIEGDVPNVDLLNTVIAGETDYFEEYYEEYSKYMLSEETFAVYSEGYVTYMDEEVMSVVFSEKIYTDYWVDCGLYCLNIDMENGVILENGSILDVDDEFAIDFRLRSRAQNGDISELDYLTDQEVVYYLTDVSTGIIFYTPLGMEIGLNYGEDYVTVTYRDYREFLLKY